MNFLVTQGIGDSVWALHKIQSIASSHEPDGQIDLQLTSSGSDEIQRRAIPFLQRFPFLDSVSLSGLNCLRHGEPATTREGYWNYLPDGIDGDRFNLMPNAALERGCRLEDWLPEYECDWSTMSKFRFTAEETRFADQIRQNIGRYVVFYLGPESGNTTEGHNRGPMWTPQQWVDLGNELQRTGLKIMVVGASYDRTYYERYVRRYGGNWFNFLGDWHIGKTLAVIRKAALTVAYQSGIGICSHYLGVPTCIWWRPKGNSASAGRYISFEEDMAHCWTNPLYRSIYLPLIYGRCSVSDIAEFARRVKA